MFKFTNPQAIPMSAAAIVQTIVLEIESDAKLLCPVDTGTLRRSIQASTPMVMGTRVTAHVGTDVTYAPHIEFGRGTVRPVNAKALSWVGKNGRVFAQSSRPTRPQPFMGPALERARARWGR